MMPSLDPIQMMLNKLANDPNITNDPVRKHMLEVLISGDAEEGQKIAQNLCETYGVSMSDAAQQARNFFQF